MNTTNEKITDLEAYKMSKTDYLVRATASDGMIRAFAAVTKDTVQEAADRHHTSPVVTAALGRLLTAGAMMGQMLKGEKDLITLTVKGDGPMGGMTVTADNTGRVKGFPNEPSVWIPPKYKGKLDVGGAVGHGILTVVRDQASGEPYSSQVELVSGEIGEDLTYYFAVSEQVPSSVGLGVLVGTDQRVLQAGGFLIQLMPGCPDETVDALEKKLSGVRSVTAMLEEGLSPVGILDELLGGMEPVVTDRVPVSFFCSCSKEHVAKVLLSLGSKELRGIIADGEPVTLPCHFCGSSYTYTIDEVKELLMKAVAKRFENFAVIDGQHQ